MKKQFVSIILTAAMLVCAAALPEQLPLTQAITVSSCAASTVAAPTASLKSGTYAFTGTKSVTLSCDEGTIYYSLNGAAYKKYTTALKLTKNSTLKFYAKSGGVKSSVITRTYKLKPKVTASVGAGTYSGAQKVTLSAKPSGTTLYYTTDGSKPTTASEKYSGAVKISKTCKLRVMAAKSGCTKSYYSYSYTINAKARKSILYDYESKYYYQSMTDNMKEIYRRIYAATEKHAKTVNLSDLVAYDWEVGYINVLFEADNPQFFWYSADDSWYDYLEMSDGSKHVQSFYVGYCFDEADSVKMQKKLEDKAQVIIDKANAESDIMDALIVIHDEVVNSCTYVVNENHMTWRAYGPLVSKMARCTGYSAAFSYLCQSIGIQCVSLTGSVTNNTDLHVWNRFNIDGKWYNMDLTWDDPIGYTQNGRTCDHVYFALTDEQIEKDHQRMIGTWYPFTQKQAAVTEFDYYEHIGATQYKTIDSALKRGLKGAAAEYKAGGRTYTIYIIPSLVEKFNYRLADEMIGIMASYGAYMDSATWNYYSDRFEITMI